MLPDFLSSLLGSLDFSKTNYRVLMRNGIPLLLIPPNRQTASMTLGLYLPQGRKAKFAVAALKAANRLRLLQRILPKLAPESDGVSVMEKAMPINQDDVDHGRVGFLLCNPDHECARVIAVRVGESDDQPASVCKWCDQAGEVKLATEIGNIRSLTEKALRGVPAILSERSNSASSWFEMAHYAHADVRSASDDRVVKLLASWMSDEWVAPLDNAFVASLWTTDKWTPNQRVFERLATLKIRKAVVHGDFATWNLRAEDERLVAIDWEWAEMDGIAGLDLCYGLLQEALLVKKLLPREALGYVYIAAATPACKAYLEVSGWAGAVDLWIKTAVFYRHSRKACPELVEALGSV